MGFQECALVDAGDCFAIAKDVTHPLWRRATSSRTKLHKVMNKLFVFLCLMSPFIISCKKCKDDGPTNQPIELCDPEKKTKLMWAKPYTKDTLPVYSVDQIAINNDVVFTFSKGNPDGPLQAHKITTGEVIWRTTIGGQSFIPSSIVTKDNYLVVENESKIWVLDQSNGSVIWTNQEFPPTETGRPRISVFGDYIYYKTVSQVGDIEDYARLYRTPITHFAPEIVYQADVITAPGRDSGYILGIECGALWKKPNGDDVVVFQTRGFRLGTNKNRTDLYAFNMTTKTVEWRLDSIDAKSTVNEPIIEGDDLYYQGESTLFKIDMKEGSVIWSYYFPFIDEHMYTSRTLIGEKYAFIQPGAGHMYAINKTDGKVAWRSSKISCCGAGKGQMQQVGDNLYYVASPYLVSVSAVKNQINWKCESPMNPFVYDNRFEQYTKTLKVPNKNIFITSDTHFLMAYEVTD